MVAQLADTVPVCLVRLLEKECRHQGDSAPNGRLGESVPGVLYRIVWR